MARRFVIFALLAAFSALAGPLADPASRLRYRPVVTFSLRPLSLEAGVAPTMTVRVDPDDGGRGHLDLAWPDAGSRCRLTVEATDGSDHDQPERLITLSFRTEVDGSALRSFRQRWTVVDGSNRILELARRDGKPLTVGLEASVDSEPFVPRAPRTTRHVRYRVQIERWIDGRAVPLESNVLDTFVGEPITYGFTLGADDLAASLDLTLRPQSIVEQLLATEVTLSGHVSDPTGRKVIGRSQRLLSTSRTVSRVPARRPESPDDPPDGYVFVVTPEF